MDFMVKQLQCQYQTSGLMSQSPRAKNWLVLVRTYITLILCQQRISPLFRTTRRTDRFHAVFEVKVLDLNLSINLKQELHTSFVTTSHYCFLLINIIHFL
jgi:hypothetical protein